MGHQQYASQLLLQKKYVIMDEEETYLIYNSMSDVGHALLILRYNAKETRISPSSDQAVFSPHLFFISTITLSLLLN